MPKIVDHQARRRDIVRAYLEVVSDEGVHAATGKAICQRLGMSTGSLWHYSDSVEEVLAQAAQSVFERDIGRIAHHATRGLAGLQQSIRALLPLDATTREEADLVVTSWAQLSSRVAVRTALASAEAFEGPLTQLIQEAVTDGDLLPSTPAALLAETLNQLRDGAQVAHVIVPDLPNERRLARIACLLAPWPADTGAPAAEQIRGWASGTSRPPAGTTTQHGSGGPGA
jgi:AcrR family transcriptional regulator